MTEAGKNRNWRVKKPGMASHCNGYIESGSAIGKVGTDVSGL